MHRSRAPPLSWEIERFTPLRSFKCQDLQRPKSDQPEDICLRLTTQPSLNERNWCPVHVMLFEKPGCLARSFTVAPQHWRSVQKGSMLSLVPRSSWDCRRRSDVASEDEDTIVTRFPFQEGIRNARAFSPYDGLRDYISNLQSKCILLLLERMVAYFRRGRSTLCGNHDFNSASGCTDHATLETRGFWATVTCDQHAFEPPRHERCCPKQVRTSPALPYFAVSSIHEAVTIPSAKLRVVLLCCLRLPLPLAPRVL